jgi:hypothetical protein
MKLLSKLDPFKLCVFFGGVLVFLILYPNLFLHPNSLFIAVEGDGMKNYFTCASQIRNGTDSFNFSGINYPYGEHITFTDGQPLLTLLLSLFPFLADHSIGILNFLVIFSFSVTPFIVYLIFQRLELGRTQSIIGAFSVSLLSPQIFRLAGHFSLCYPIFYVLLILFLIDFFKTPTIKISFKLFILILSSFLVHPYTGFALTVFSVIALTMFWILNRSSVYVKNFRFILKFVLASISALVFFKLIILLTDTHGYRYDTPYGYDFYTASPGSVFVPSEGPFRHFLSQIIKVYSQQWEGLGYIGICTILTFVISFILKVLFLKKFHFPKYFFILFLPALLLLLFSFGYHFRFGDNFTNSLGPIKQLRATGRFCWLFYYVSTIFCFILVDKICITFFGQKKQPVALILTFVFGVIFIIEAIPFHSRVISFAGTTKNYFDRDQVDTATEKVIHELKKNNYQSILTLPYFHIGSEFFIREPLSRPYLEAMTLSYHTGIPLMGNVGSRTALDETKSGIGIINLFTDKSSIRKKSNSTLPIAVLVNGELTNYDEQEFLKKCRFVKDLGNLKLYVVTWDEIVANPLLENLPEKENLLENTYFTSDSSNFIASNSNGFTKGNTAQEKTILTIDPDQLEEGEYIFSCRYYYDTEAELINNNFELETIENDRTMRLRIGNIRCESGIFKNFIVAEFPFSIKSKNAIHKIRSTGGIYDLKFTLSHIMVRKRNARVFQTNNAREIISVNNYPIR